MFFAYSLSDFRHFSHLKKGSLIQLGNGKEGMPQRLAFAENAEWDELYRFVDRNIGSERPYNNDYAYGRSMIYYREYAHWYYSDKSNLYSVRCVKD